MRKRGFVVFLLIVSCVISSFASVYATYTPTGDAYALVNYLNEKVGNSFTSNACQAFVYQSIHNCFGVGNTKSACCATKAWQSYGISSSRNDIPLGAAVYFGGSSVTDSSCGQLAGHVGLYVGDGYIVHAWSKKIVKTTIDYVINCNYSYRGWGWQGDYALATTTPSINEVVCSTGDATNIASNSATFTGTFTNPTGAKIVKRGLQWGNSTAMTNYTWFDCNITWADGLSHNMTGLSSNTTYYYKLIVQGDNGTVIYGNTKSFKTNSIPSSQIICLTQEAGDITTYSAKLYGTFSNPAQSRIIKRGFQWGSSVNMPNYTMFDCNITWDDGLSHTISGLTPNTTYYYKLVTQSEDGSFSYGNVISFKTLAAPSSAVICTTQDAGDITTSSAKLYGVFSNPNGARIVKRGFQWGTTIDMPNYTTFDCNITWNDGLSHYMPGLKPGTTYYYKLVVQDEYGVWIYGNVKNFTTLQTVPQIPQISILETDTDCAISWYSENADSYWIAIRYENDAWYNECINTKNTSMHYNFTPGIYKINVEAVNSAGSSNSGYTKFSVGRYIISYSTNGGNGLICNQVKQYGTPLTLTSTIPTRNGYTFVGWSENPNTINSTWLAGGTFADNRNAILYACWKANTYNIKFESNSDECTIHDKIVEYASTYGDLPTPVRKGYTFKGWYTSNNGGDRIISSSSVQITSDQTLYARWEQALYSIVYDTNGGIENSWTDSCEYDTVINISKTVPTREGYKFIGWAKDKDAAIADYMPDDLYSENQDVVLYAVWKIIPYTKTEITNFGAYKLCNVTLNYIENTPTIIVATYKDGKLLGIEKRVYSKENETFAVFGDIDTVKVMVWDDISTIRPITAVEEIPNSKWITK